MQTRLVTIVGVALTVAAAPRATRAQTRDVSVYYGTERATLGPWFGALAIGGVETPRLPAPPSDVKVELVTSGRRIDGVDITIPADSCPELERRLAHLWGAPSRDGWQATSAVQGARLETSVDLDHACKLRFFRRVSPGQWLSWSRRSVVPIWAIGKPASELEAAIAVLVPEHDDREIRWQDTAIDGTHVTLSATVRTTQVVAITVTTSIDSHPAPVWRRLRAMFGAPDSATTHDDTYRWRWRRAPRIEVSTFVGDSPSPPPGTAARTPPIPAMPRDPGFPLTISFGAE